MAEEKKPYSKLLKDELLQIAERLGLTNLGSLKKTEIIDLIKKVSSRTTAGPASARSASSSGMYSANKSDHAKEKTGKDVPPSLPSASPSTTKGQSKAPTKTSVSLSTQAKALASKYASSIPFKAKTLQKIDDAAPELPENYSENRIVLLPRDLTWLFTYWELTEEYKEAARAAGGRVLALRLYDVTGVAFSGMNAHSVQEHECAEWARSWYLPSPLTGRDFIVEIGYRGGDQWFPLARSNKVSVPSDQPSTWVKDDFITIPFNTPLNHFEKQQDVAPSHMLQEGAAPIEEHVGFESQSFVIDGELRVIVGAGTHLSPSGVPGWGPSSGGFQLMTASGSAAVPFSGAIPAPTSYGMAPSSQAFLLSSQAFGIPSSQSMLPSSFAFAPMPVGFLPSSQSHVHPQLVTIPSSQGMVQPSHALSTWPELYHPLPNDMGEHLHPGHPLTADMEPTPPPPAPLFLTAVEMVVTGKSEPGTDIRIAGRPIPVGPDGCFSLRVNVPEGVRELPIEARRKNSARTQKLTLHLGKASG